MNDEKTNKEFSETNSESETGNKMAEEILNEIEMESRAEASDTIPEDNQTESEEGLLSKIGFSKKDKHKKEIKELNDKIHELNDKHLRLYAEFDNFKKRNAKERLELIHTAGQEVITSLLTIMDDFQRALRQMESAKDVEAIREGVNLIFLKLFTTLEQRGLKAMVSIGQEFNPGLHEAIAEVPAPSEDLKGKVIDEIEKGYFLNDKIIRFAKVIVGK